MKDFIHQTLNKMADDTSVISIKPVSGGDINQSYKVETEQHAYFIKINRNVPSHFFEAEAHGLTLIRESHTIRVPEVYHYDKPQPGENAALAMEWVDPGPLSSPELLGHQLAHMHKQSSEKYGFGEPTFVGELDQPNNWSSSWVEYYQNFRLNNQLQIGNENGVISGKRRARLEKLIDRLDEWLPSPPRSSLLHGDLWGGNWMADIEGHPLLIDPSVLYGDHAFEMAFTELFGGFPRGFYDAYEEVFPLPDEYEDTKPLYQLFYLLVHLNTFGGSYGSSVDRILKRYVG